MKGSAEAPSPRSIESDTECDRHLSRPRGADMVLSHCDEMRASVEPASVPLFCGLAVSLNPRYSHAGKHDFKPSPSASEKVCSGVLRGSRESPGTLPLSKAPEAKLLVRVGFFDALVLRTS